MKRFLPLSVLLGFLAAIALASPASALSCVALPQRVDHADVVLVGTVTAKPERGLAMLAVERLYKGTADRSVAVDISAIGPNSMWIHEEPAIGQRILVGLRRRDSGFQLPICGVYDPLAAGEEVPPEVAALLGAGTPIGGAAEAPAADRLSVPFGPASDSGSTAAVLSFALLGLAALALLYVRRRRAR